MNAKTKILIGILIIGVIGGSGLFVLYILGIIPPWRPGPPILGTVSISTDKTEYEQGEGITITIKNTLDKSIWYIKETCPPSCCNLYRWEEDKWKNLGDPMPCIQLIPPPPGEPYHIEPDELRPAGSISKQWDMMIGGETAESGKYRLSFYYGLSRDKYTEKTIYSNEFTIKEVVSQQIIDKCKEEKKVTDEVRSDPDCLKGEEFRCVDGWGVTWYYDKRIAGTKEFPSTFPSDAPKELKEATVAEHSSSVCSCKNPISYRILVGDKLEEATCEEFYKFIEDYNFSCGDCLLEWSFECC